MPRTHQFERNADALRQFAELSASGASNAVLAETFAVTERTVTDWSKRADVQALISELRERRVNRVLRTVDAAVLSILESPERRSKLDLKDLLAIRKEYSPRQVEVGRSGDFDRAAVELEAWSALDAGDLPAELPAEIGSDDR